jgi:hypothetical protein
VGWLHVQGGGEGGIEKNIVLVGVFASQSKIISSMLLHDYKADLHNEQMYSSLNGSVPTDSLPNNVHLCSQTLGGLGPRQKTSKIES